MEAQGTLDVTPDKLSDVGRTHDNKYEELRALFDSMTNTINTVNEDSNWKSAASDELKKDLDNIGPILKGILDQLEQVGPELQATAGNYQKAEDDNTAKMKEEHPWQA